jgi:hypothetical protein
MSLGRHSFKLNDATRFVRALKAAGLSITRLELDKGKVIAVTSGGATSDKIEDEVESWVSKQRAHKR